MPELKRNFLKGKMNKDLDERLVPSGEYRDALNIEISTSEGSNVGSAQTLRGNKLADNSSNLYSSTAITVGTYVDEESEAIYNFVHKRSDTFNDTYANYTPGDKFRVVGFRADSILRHIKDPLTENVTTDIVFNDSYEVRVANGVIPTTNNQRIVGLTNFNWSRYTCIDNNPNFPDQPPVCLTENLYVAQGIKPGMRVQAIDVNGVDLWGDQDIRVVDILDTVGGEDHAVKITPVRGYAQGYSEYFGVNMQNDGVVLRFTADRVLQFNAGTEEIEVNNTLADGTAAYSTAQYTPKNNIITGINIVDDLLYWTDGKNEPKKINITNSIAGTKYGASSYWRFNPTRVYVPQTLRRLSPAKLSNITVIRPAPIKPPTIKVVDSKREGTTTATVRRLLSTGPAHFALRQYPSVEGGVFDIGPLTSTFTVPLGTNWKVGDTIDLVEYTNSEGTPIVSPKSAIIRITSFNQNSESITFNCDLVAIDVNYAFNASPAVWKGTLSDKKTSIYPKKFISFAYRYKYIDNEISVISPYTKPIFLPGKYNYDPKNGFNLGMENQIKSFAIENYIPADIPEDVVQVELLYKDTSKADKTYSLKTVSVKDWDWSLRNVINSKAKGYTLIESELFGPTLPTDQVDRNEDFVPKSAISQEITESRLMYGNYVEGYNVGEVEIDAWLNPKPALINTSTSFSANTFVAVQRDAASTDDASLPYSTAVACSIEEVDEGDNYEDDGTQPDPYSYTVPQDGVYSFKASADWLARNLVSCTSSDSLSSPANFWHFTPARLVLRKYDGATNPVIPTTSPDDIAYSQGGTINNNYYPDIEAPNTFINADALGIFPGQDPNWEANEINLEANNIYLTAGTKVFLSVEPIKSLPDDFTFDVVTSSSWQPATEYVSGSATFPWTPDEFDDDTQIDFAQVSNASFKCTAAPDTENSFIVTAGTESIKSNRVLKIGVVYRDSYNRQSTVLLDETLKLNVPKSESINANNLAVKIKNKAPEWAEYYKFFIKEDTNTFHNLVMGEALNNNDTDADQLFAWLTFNSVDVDKVKEEDYIILKKKHNSTEAVLAEEARWKILEISNDVPETAILADGSATVGKFFAKIAQDAAFNTYIGSFGTASDPSAPSTNGAVFETEPKQIEKSEETSIYYEVGQAYPIKLDVKNAESYISIGDRVEYYGSSYQQNDAIVESIKSQLQTTKVTVTKVRGAYTFDKGLMTAAAGYVSADNTTTNPDHAYCVVNASELLNIEINGNNYVDLKFTKSDYSFVVARVIASSNGDNRIYLLPYTHYNDNLFPNNPDQYEFVKGLPWYNCFMFGNGVESDTIRDDFNGDTIFDYIPAGKTSGFKASAFYEDYKETRKKNDIIFSEIYNEKSNVNRLNEFLIGKNIVKQLAPEYGSIQKLFTRNSDLLAFCENKVIQILANKDELFNADGSSLLVDGSKVLGRARPFAGDYGISKNPESFASDEFRIYFTDKARGAVLRLSRDGITNISDYGMKNWFYDNLAYSQALVGSFDGKKNEYNITLHSVTNPGSKKDVYTISFSESVNGWTCFKGFIKEVGATLNNFYYTFKNGKPWIHHSEDVNRNLFYSKQYDSSVQPIFNDFPGSVKTFSTINYEGTQSKITQNTDSRDPNYYNLSDENGWYVKSIETDLQEGKVNEFINKEGKWFNNIVGETTTFNNAADSGSATGNLDTREISVQGLGTLSSNPTIISGTIDGFGFDVTLPITTNNNWSID